MVREISIFPCGLEISLLLHEQSLSSYGFPGYNLYKSAIYNYDALVMATHAKQQVAKRAQLLVHVGMINPRRVGGHGL